MHHSFPFCLIFSFLCFVLHDRFFLGLFFVLSFRGRTEDMSRTQEAADNTRRRENQRRVRISFPFSPFRSPFIFLRISFYSDTHTKPVREHVVEQNRKKTVLATISRMVQLLLCSVWTCAIRNRRNDIYNMLCNTCFFLSVEIRDNTSSRTVVTQGTVQIILRGAFYFYYK
jgi:hypothetical protein